MAVPASIVRRSRATATSPWVGFLVRRLVRLVVSLLFIVTLAFGMIHLVPGDPVRAALGDTATPQLLALRRHELGLDQPLLEQYGHFLSNLLHGDLGESIGFQLPVSEVIGDRLPATLTLAGLSLLVVLLLAVPIGVAMAILTQGGRRRGAELGFTTVAGVLAVVPEFLLAVGLVYLFAVTLPWFPVAGRSDASSYVLPVLALSLGAIAALARIVRAEALTVLSEDFVRTARAKRLPARRVYVRHAFPNLLTSALTIGGLLVGALIAGSVLVETVFAWPGLGSTIVQSIQQKDYPLVQGIVIVYATAVLLANLLVDLLLAVLDPRSTVRER